MGIECKSNIHLSLYGVQLLIEYDFLSVCYSEIIVYMVSQFFTFSHHEICLYRPPGHAQT